MPWPDLGGGRSPASLRGILFRLHPLASWEKEERGFQSFSQAREEGVEVIYKTIPRRAPSIRPFAGAAATPAGRGRGAAGSVGADVLGVSGGPTVGCPGSLAAPSPAAEERPGPSDPRAAGQERVPRALGRGRRGRAAALTVLAEPWPPRPRGAKNPRPRACPRGAWPPAALRARRRLWAELRGLPGGRTGGLAPSPRFTISSWERPSAPLLP